MEENRFKAMIIAYFLSREDERAYRELGYGTQVATHDAIGERFGVKRNTVKNWRDEFDAIHDNTRQGWYQRPLRPSRIRLAERYQDLSFDALLVLARYLMSKADSEPKMELSAVAVAPDAAENSSEEIETEEIENVSTNYGARGATGWAAEDAFSRYHASAAKPVPGVLLDRRISGAGYDYEIVTDSGSVFVEVKGLAGKTGTVSLTGREWETAKELKERYFLALVLEAGTSPQVLCVQNPSALFSPVLRLVPTVQEQWRLVASQIVALAT